MSPEVGNSREKDLVAMLSLKYPKETDYNIPNDAKEDVVFCGEKISIKHKTVSGRSLNYSGIKLVWTVDAKSQEDFLNAYHVETGLLLVFLAEAFIHVNYITRDNLLQQVERYPGKFYKTLGGNSRGIEYDPTFLRETFSAGNLSIRIPRDPLPDRVDAITERQQLASII